MRAPPANFSRGPDGSVRFSIPVVIDAMHVARKTIKVILAVTPLARLRPETLLMTNERFIDYVENMPWPHNP